MTNRPRWRLRSLALLALPLLHHGVTVAASPIDADAPPLAGADGQQKILAPQGDTIDLAPQDDAADLAPQDDTIDLDAISDDPADHAATSTSAAAASPRKLRGRFLHITDFHPDDYYKTHTSTGAGYACHRSKGPAGYYGAETSDCDSPFTLVNATLDWIRDNVVDDIDFVVWTGDTARHDSDEKIPRNQRQVLGTNRRVADLFYDTFSSPHAGQRLAVPVVPNLGNNDILPHNILTPGPTRWLQYYADIWRHFIPEEQRHTFDLGGWFNVEVIPGRLAVFSLNTLYLFDRNAAVDGCTTPSEPGFMQMEWLRIQLQVMRERGMKAILIGHVPPARTNSKQNWDETCWQKYNLWLRQYRDVITGTVWGHMNINHFILHDTDDINLAAINGREHAGRSRKTKDVVHSRQQLEDDFSVASASDYLRELRRGWSKIPMPGVKALVEDDLAEEEHEDEDGDDSADAQKKRKGKKGKKRKGHKDIGGKFAERYHLSLISPSIVPNYFPTLRIYDYNINGIEDAAVWADSFSQDEWANHVFPLTAEAEAEAATTTTRDVDPASGQVDTTEEDEQEDLDDSEDDTDDIEAARGKKHKKKKGRKGKKGKKKPKDPNLVMPDPPAKHAPPGPAYSPQPLTFMGYTQYFANLTYINNDMTQDGDEGGASAERWKDGIHRGKDPKTKKPKPNPFEFKVEYSTFTDKIYKLKDMTVRSYVKLAYRIGQQKAKGKTLAEALEGEDGEPDDFEDDEDEDEDEDEEVDQDEDDSGLEDGDEDEDDGDVEAEGKGKKGKKKKKKNKAWMHFLSHAFVDTVPRKQLRKL